MLIYADADAASDPAQRRIRLATDSHLTGRLYACKQCREIGALDLNDLDAARHFEKARIECPDLHIAEIHQCSTASAMALALACKARDHTFIRRPDVAREVTSRTSVAFDPYAHGVEPIHPLASFANLSHVTAAVQHVD